jgi:hypothetical protein
MKIPLAAIVLLAILSTAFAGDIKPDKPETPLFQIFEPIPQEAKGKSGLPSYTFDPKRPLLAVSTVRDLILAHDNKGVMLGLNANDTKAFAAITRKYNGRLLILVTTDNLIEAMHITAPIEDGYLGFKHPDQGAIAEYLRMRFHIAEFK